MKDNDSKGNECQSVTLIDLLSSEWRILVALRSTRRRIIAAMGNGLSYADYALLNSTLVRVSKLAARLKALDDSTKGQ